MRTLREEPLANPLKKKGPFFRIFCLKFFFFFFFFLQRSVRFSMLGKFPSQYFLLFYFILLKYYFLLFYFFIKN
jgi:hypothetical protein